MEKPFSVSRSTKRCVSNTMAWFMGALYVQLHGCLKLLQGYFEFSLSRLIRRADGKALDAAAAMCRDAPAVAKERGDGQALDQERGGVGRGVGAPRVVEGRNERMRSLVRPVPFADTG